MAKRGALGLVLVALLLSGGCAAGSEASVRPELLRLTPVDTRSADTTLVPVKLVSNWSVRSTTPNGIWLLERTGRGSELAIRRRESVTTDYEAHLAREAARVGEMGYSVSGPLTTTLFGRPAASYTITRDGYARLYVGSSAWTADARVTESLDPHWASEITAMLGGSRFPAQ